MGDFHRNISNFSNIPLEISSHPVILHFDIPNFRIFVLTWVPTHCSIMPQFLGSWYRFLDKFQIFHIWILKLQHRCRFYVSICVSFLSTNFFLPVTNDSASNTFVQCSSGIGGGSNDANSCWSMLASADLEERASIEISF